MFGSNNIQDWTTSLTSTSISIVSMSESTVSATASTTSGSTVSTTASTVLTTEKSISDAGVETTATESVTMTTTSIVNFPTANGSIETGTTNLTTMTTTGTFTLAVAPAVVPFSPADARLFATVHSTVSFSVSPGDWLLELGAQGRAAVQDAVVESVAETLGVPQDQVRAEGVRLGERRGAGGLRRSEGPPQALDVEVGFAVSVQNKTEMSRLEYLVSMWLPDPGSFTFESYIANHLHDVSFGAAITVRGAQFTEAQKACPCAAGFGRSVQCGDDACARCEANEFGGEDGVCQVCPDGTEPSASRDRCQACAQDSAGTKGICSRCPEGSEPTEDRTSCENERGWLGLTDSEWTALGVVAGVMGVLLTLAGLGCWKSFATKGAEQVSSSTRRLASLSSVRSRGSASTPPQTPGSALSSRSIDSRCIIDILASTGDIDEEDFLEIIRSARSRRRSGGLSLSSTPKHMVAEGASPRTQVAGSPVSGSPGAGRGSRWPRKADCSPRGAGPTASPLSCASTTQSSTGGCGSASLPRSQTTPCSLSLGSSPRSTIAV